MISLVLINKIWWQFSSWHKITPPVAQTKSYFHRKVLFSMFPWVKGLIVTQASVCQRRLVLTFSNTRTTTLSGALSGAGSNLSGLFMCSCYCGVLVLTVVTVSIWCTVWCWRLSWCSVHVLSPWSIGVGGGWWQFPRVPGFCLVLPLLMAVLRAGSTHHSLSRGYTAPAHTNSCPSNTNTNTDKYKHSLSFTQSRIHQLTCDHTTICKCSLSQQTEEIWPGVFERYQKLNTIRDTNTSQKFTIWK